VTTPFGGPPQAPSASPDSPLLTQSVKLLVPPPPQMAQFSESSVAVRNSAWMLLACRKMLASLAKPPEPHASSSTAVENGWPTPAS